MHARPPGKHSTGCTNKSDPCQKGPAFSVGPHSGQLAISVTIQMTSQIVSEVGKRIAHTSLEYRPCLEFSYPIPGIPASLLFRKGSNKELETKISQSDHLAGVPTVPAVCKLRVIQSPSKGPRHPWQTVCQSSNLDPPPVILVASVFYSIEVLLLF